MRSCEAKNEHLTPIASIKNLWHNSFLDSIRLEASTGSLVTNSSAEDAKNLLHLATESTTFNSTLQESSRLVLSSVRQGRNLQRDAHLLRIKTNEGFLESVVMRQGNRLESKRVGQFSLAILGPTKSQLDDLRKKWKSELPDILKPKSNLTSSLQLAGNLDSSIANLSSLVVEVSVNGKTALLTGDARSDHIITAMDEVGWLKKGTWPVDLLKVPHHGSEQNVTQEFFAKVPARHYVISGNGKHGNPEPEMFEMIFAARTGQDFDLHLTYGPEELRAHNEFDWSSFKQVMNRHNGWSRLRYPDLGELSVTVKLA